jgi:hypothetical protein
MRGALRPTPSCRGAFVQRRFYRLKNPYISRMKRELIMLIALPVIKDGQLYTRDSILDDTFNENNVMCEFI